MPAHEVRKIGLSRALSKLGYCSRAKAAELIRAGRVRLNNSVRRNPETPTSLERDRITVDGQAIEPQRKIYLMLNKPGGLVTTASDEKGRDTVYSLLTSAAAPLPWIAPVGRLDKASEGLLLLTNDSEWGARIASPETHVDKTYHVQIDRVADHEIIRALMTGVSVDDEHLSAKRVQLLRAGQKNSWLEITLDEGKNRQIRRMLAVLGVEVLRLVRIAIGPLQLGKLPKGAFRELTEQEINLLNQSMHADKSATTKATK